MRDDERSGPDPDAETGHVEARLAARLAELRATRSWSLDALAARTGISRATLSRLERGEISPTAAMLGRLCAAYGWTLSRLMAEAEAGPPHLLRAGDQPRWKDPETGFRRRAVSPPLDGLRAELVEGVLPAGATIAYDAPPVVGQEQHVWVFEGRLDLEIDGVVHRLDTGDCLRYRLLGPTRFTCPGPAPVRYLVAIVQH